MILMRKKVREWVKIFKISWHDETNLNLLRSNTEWERLMSSVCEVFLWWSWLVFCFEWWKNDKPKAIKKYLKEFFYSYNSIPNEISKKKFRLISIKIIAKSLERFSWCFCEFWIIFECEIVKIMSDFLAVFLSSHCFARFKSQTKLNFLFCSNI